MIIEARKRLRGVKNQGRKPVRSSIRPSKVLDRHCTLNRLRNCFLHTVLDMIDGVERLPHIDQIQSVTPSESKTSQEADDSNQRRSPYVAY